MGRGLSQLQRDILGIVCNANRSLMAGDVLDALRLPKTPSTRASVSRALRRLVQRKELDALLMEVVLTGDGYRYAPHDPTRPTAPADWIRVKQRR